MANDNPQAGKELVPENGERSVVPAELNKLLDRLNFEAKQRADVEKKSLEIADKDNEREFFLEQKRLELQSEYFTKKQSNDFKIYIIIAIGGFFFFCSLVYFAYQGKMGVVKDIFFPLLLSIISALGGYGIGVNKGRKINKEE